MNLAQLVETIGYLGVFGMVFAESGLLIGVFFPGDSLLFTAGFLSSQGIFQLPVLIVTCTVAAITGDSVGYSFGHKVGKRLFTRQDSIFFHKDHLQRAKIFYQKHGGKTIILARFMPIIRTFAPIVAGMGEMHYAAFLFYNILGGLLWSVGVITLGYFLGSAVPDVDRYLLPIVASIIFVSILPSFLHILKTPSHRDEIKKEVVKLLCTFKEKLLSRDVETS